MIKAVLVSVCVFLSFAVSAANPSLSPLDVVNARMEAYNNHDIDAFIKVYSDDIQIYTYPNVAIGKKGKAHLRSIFEPMFSEGLVSVKIHEQISQGGYVINHETVTYAGKDTKYVSIYEVENGLITNVQFVRE